MNVSALKVQLQRPDGIWVDVGYLYNSDEKNWFEFTDSYWDTVDRPVLGQIFEERGRAWQPNAHVALPHWFSHLLPEGRLREAVASAAHTNKVREFNILARIGMDDLPGAIRVGIAAELKNVQTPPEILEAERASADEDPLLKFSLAGAQLKFSVFSDKKGLTIPARGQVGNVIAKLPDGRPNHAGVPEAEFASMELARLAGIEVPFGQLTSLHSITGLEGWADKVSGPVFVIDRFDRGPGDRRIHMEELAQVLNIPARREDVKYKRANFETIARIIGALTGTESVYKVIDRIVFNVLIGNGDAHLKNWAVVYRDGITPTLSPLYDVLPTVLYLPDDDLGLNLNGSKNFSDVRIASFSRLAERSGISVSSAGERVRTMVEKTLDNWESLRILLPRESYERLTRRRDMLPITREI